MNNLPMQPHPRATEIEKIRSSKVREIKKKEKEVRAKDDKILQLADKITTKSFTLKQGNAHTKANQFF